MRFDVSAVRGSVVTWKPPPLTPTPPTLGWLKVTLQQLFELRLQQVEVGGGVRWWLGGPDVRREEPGGSKGLLSAAFTILMGTLPGPPLNCAKLIWRSSHVLYANAAVLSTQGASGGVGGGLMGLDAQQGGR